MSQIPDLTETNIPAVKPFVAQGAKYHSSPRTPAQLLGWHAGMVLVEGLRRAGNDLTRENLIQALETLQDFPGIFKWQVIKDAVSGPFRSADPARHFSLPVTPADRLRAATSALRLPTGRPRPAA